MKYTHILLISIMIPSIISSTETKRSSSSIKKVLIDWIYRGKTVITIPDNHDISIKLDRNSTLNVDNSTKVYKKNSSKNNIYKRY